jgi:hypothetical protein
VNDWIALPAQRSPTSASHGNNQIVRRFFTAAVFGARKRSGTGRLLMRNYLNDCQKIEPVIGEVYRNLADVETYSPRLRSIFARMALDEAEHVRQLEQAKDIPEEAFARGKRFDQKKHDALLQQARQLLRLASGPAPSEKPMVETAKDLEMEFIKVHLQNAVRSRDAAMAERFQKMAREDQEHFEVLDSYDDNN